MYAEGVRQALLEKLGAAGGAANPTLLKRISKFLASRPEWQKYLGLGALGAGTGAGVGALAGEDLGDVLTGALAGAAAPTAGLAALRGAQRLLKTQRLARALRQHPRLQQALPYVGAGLGGGAGLLGGAALGQLGEAVLD